MWGVILEKAIAKLSGNYAHLHGGEPRESARTLSGSPSIMYNHHGNLGKSIDFIWEELLRHDVNNEMMFYQTPEGSGNGYRLDSCGLRIGHAYVVLEAFELSTGAKIIKLRDPWGIDRYHCDYSDDSDLWTAQTRAEAGIFPSIEGIIFLDLETYHKHGATTVISFDTSEWYSDHFLMLDDQTYNPGTWSWCGKTCTRHEIDITSSVDQEVYVTAHTWEKRSYPKECILRETEKKPHSIYRKGDRNVVLFKDGVQ